MIDDFTHFDIETKPLAFLEETCDSMLTDNSH